MNKPDIRHTIINVKGIDLAQWERAKVCATRSDETMGEWLNRAIRQLADMEAGGREFGPNGSANPRQAMTPEQVAALMQATAVLQAATGKPLPSRSAANLRAVADDLARAARGLPPREVKQPAKRGAVFGQAVLVEGPKKPVLPGPKR